MTDAERLLNLASLSQPQADEPEIVADANACRAGAAALTENEALRKRVAALEATLRESAKCQRCRGTGAVEYVCDRCRDSTDDHECPSTVTCAACKGTGALPSLAADTSALNAALSKARSEGAREMRERWNDALSSFVDIYRQTKLAAEARDLSGSYALECLAEPLSKLVRLWGESPLRDVADAVTPKGRG